MMRIGIFTSLLLISTVLSGQNNPKPGPTKIKHSALEMSEGVAYYKGLPFTGMSIVFWENNKINEQFTWVNGIKDGEYKEFTDEGKLVTKVMWSGGVKDGPYEYFYYTGAPQSNGHFKQGELDGLVTGYFITGIKKYEVNYTMGVRNGASRSWFKNGAPEQIANYSNNLPHGDVFEYYPDSILFSEAEYNMGIRNGRYYEFHRKSGCPALESYYKNGKMDSVRRMWNELNCLILLEEHYLLGEKHGSFLGFDANGDTLSVRTYARGKLDGPYRTWDSRKVPQTVISKKTGQPVHLYTMERGIDVIGQYSDGEPDGFWQYGLFTNYQHRDGTYDQGKMTGLWNYYDLEGRLLMQQWYEDSGELKKERRYKRPRKKK